MGCKTQNLRLRLICQCLILAEVLREPTYTHKQMHAVGTIGVKIFLTRLTK
jgi:hypothetical protein